MKRIKDVPYLLEGGIYKDERGELLYNNLFDFGNIKRFYLITHNDTETVRAWHGHKNEMKFFYVIKGSFLINSVKIDNWEKPSDNLTPFSFQLKREETKMLCVPAGYANGFKALEPESIVLIFSDSTLEESLNDDFRFDKNRWFDWSEDEL